MTNFLLYTKQMIKAVRERSGGRGLIEGEAVWYKVSESAIQTVVGEPEQSGFEELISNWNFWIIFIYLLFSECKLQHHLLKTHIRLRVTEYSLNKLSNSPLMSPVSWMS